MDRREHDRLAMPTVTLRVKDADKFRSRYLRDLSMGGLFVQTKKVLPMGSELQIELFPPGATDEDALLLSGSVVRLDYRDDGETPRGMAIQFDQIDALLQSTLDTLIQKYSIPDEPEPDELAPSSSPPPAPKEEPELEPAAPSGGGDQSLALKTLESEIVALRQRLSESDVRIMGLHEEIETWEADDAEQRELVENLLAANAELKARQEALANTLKGIATDNEQLKKLLDSASQEGETARQEFWKLNADVAQMLAAEQQKSHRAQESLRELNDELNRQLRDAQGQFERAQNDEQSKAAALSALEQMENTMRNQAEQHATERLGWEGRLAEAEAALSALRSAPEAAPSTDQSRYERLEKRFERARSSERHLRKMLKILTEKESKGETLVSDDELRQLQGRVGMDFEFTAEDDLDVQGFVSEEAKLPGVGEVSVDFDDDDEAEAVFESTPMPPVPEDEDVIFEVDEDGEGDAELDTEAAAIDGLGDRSSAETSTELNTTPLTDANGRLLVDTFRAKLESGVLIELTERFHAIDVTDRNEMKLSSVMQEHHSLEDIKKNIPWRMRKRVVEDMYSFYQRDQIRLAAHG